jgi:penicillin-binding protein 2
MKYSLMTTDEILQLRGRLTLIAFAVGVLFLVVLLRLWYLQVLSGEYYAELARGNRIRVIPQEAPRGIVYDRNGVILAFNRPAFNIQLIPEDTPDLAEALGNLSRVTEVPFRTLLASAKENRSAQKFKPTLLLTDIGRKTADLIDSYQENLPGISVAIESKRLYPTAYLSSHVLGYVGAINESQLKQLPLRKLYSGRIVGQAGIEAILNDTLIGVDGGRQVEVDNVGRELRVLGQPVKPLPGSDITLTIDLRLQRHIRTLMAGRSGVVIVSKPRTGEILSLNSFPDYDPNLFVGGIKDEHWNTLTQGEKRPLINKATQGLYPPGSTFKMVLAAAALDQGIIDEETTLDCPGYFRLNREISYCWNRAGHGEVAVREALAKSCNVFFYKLGLELGVDRISQFAAMFGLGRPTGVELDSEKGGLLPSKAWKRRVLKEKWYIGETIPIAIGQGYLALTPIQMLNYVNVIANRGLWVRPTVLKRVVTADGQEMLSPEDLPRETSLLPIKEEYFDVIREGMVQAVEGKGTARTARSRRFVVAGKTGTSQVIGRAAVRADEDEQDERFKPHSLFTGFAPAHNPQVSVFVLVEHGGSGSRAAAPIAKKILEFYAQNIETFAPESIPIEARRDGGAGFRKQLAEAFDTLPPAPAQAANARPDRD